MTTFLFIEPSRDAPYFLRDKFRAHRTDAWCLSTHGDFLLLRAGRTPHARTLRCNIVPELDS